MPSDDQNNSFEFYKTIADFIVDKVSIRPVIGLICGSGLSNLANNLSDTVSLDYKDIPNFPSTTVSGHPGRLVFGKLEELDVVCLQGRFHYFEGYSLNACAMPVRIMKLIGVKYLFVTNAAGSLNENYNVGDIMLLKDHLNMIGIAGHSPLRGRNDSEFGTRFTPMTNSYDSRLLAFAKKAAKEIGIDSKLHEGVYCCVAGPNFESVADSKMLRLLGADAVGMSTVPEVIAARHCGLTVFGFSLITNKCIMDYDNCDGEANHEDVLNVAGNLEKSCADLIRHVVRAIRQSTQLVK